MNWNGLKIDAILHFFEREKTAFLCLDIYKTFLCFFRLLVQFSSLTFGESFLSACVCVCVLACQGMNPVFKPGNASCSHLICITAYILLYGFVAKFYKRFIYKLLVPAECRLFLPDFDACVMCTHA